MSDRRKQAQVLPVLVLRTIARTAARSAGGSEGHDRATSASSGESRSRTPSRTPRHCSAPSSRGAPSIDATPCAGERRGLEAAPGFEPGNNGFAIRCLTTWLCRRSCGQESLSPSASGSSRARATSIGMLCARTGVRIGSRVERARTTSARSETACRAPIRPCAGPRGSGGIGRRIGLKIRSLTAWGFESPLPHPRSPRTRRPRVGSNGAHGSSGNTHRRRRPVRRPPR